MCDVRISTPFTVMLWTCYYLCPSCYFGALTPPCFILRMVCSGVPFMEASQNNNIVCRGIDDKGHLGEVCFFMFGLYLFWVTLLNKFSRTNLYSLLSSRTSNFCYQTFNGVTFWYSQSCHSMTAKNDSPIAYRTRNTLSNIAIDQCSQF